MTAIERAVKKQERLDVVQAKVDQYNRQAEALEPYIKAYWRALVEIWQLEKNTDRDNAILAKYGLGEIETLTRPPWLYYYSDKRAPSVTFSWNADLFNLNRALRV